MLKLPRLYIKKTACTSSLEIILNKNTFNFKQFKKNREKRMIIEPNYREVLNANISRRGARYMKMGLYTALKCLESNTKEIDAIIVGTGIGDFSFTEKFLLEMIEKKEENLSPNTFIQSMDSLISANIAILTQSDGYNTTYVNRGVSFENTIIDAGLHFLEDKTNLILVGAADELTANYAKAISKSGFLDTKHSKTIKKSLGEGSVFALLSNKGIKGEVFIEDIQVLLNASTDEINKTIKQLLVNNKIGFKDISLMLADRELVSNLYGLDKLPTIYYKDYVGEYPTSSSFAVWLSEKILITQHIPNLICVNNTVPSTFRKIIIVNQYKNNTSIILISL